MLLAKGSGLANHLSCNNSSHKFKETVEEVLIMIFKKTTTTYKSLPDGTMTQVDTTL
jgi:hypothetical protein